MSHLSPRPSLESDDRHLWSERNNLKLWMANSFLSKCVVAHSVESAPQFSRLISVIQIKLGIISLQARYLTSSVIPIIDFPLNIANFRTWKPKTIDIIFNAFNLHKVCHTQASLSAYRDRLWVAICDSPFVKCLVGESLSTEYVYWVLIGLVKLDYHIEMIFFIQFFYLLGGSLQLVCTLIVMENLQKSKTLSFFKQIYGFEVYVQWTLLIGLHSQLPC